MFVFRPSRLSPSLLSPVVLLSGSLFFTLGFYTGDLGLREEDEEEDEEEDDEDGEYMRLLFLSLCLLRCLLLDRY